MRAYLICIVGVAGGVALALSGCLPQTSGDVVESEVTNRLGSTELVLGSCLGEWMKHLGHPAIIEQKDEGNTFFYWPDRGIAVFCHPLFRKQYEHKKREDWVVTTILVPLTNTVHPRLPPVENNARIRFSKLLIYYSEVMQLRWDTKSNVKLNTDNGIVESLEIQKSDSLLTEYD
jgi:hypothetical protein